MPCWLLPINKAAVGNRVGCGHKISIDLAHTKGHKWWDCLRISLVLLVLSLSFLDCNTIHLYKAVKLSSKVAVQFSVSTNSEGCFSHSPTLPAFGIVSAFQS